MTCIVAYIQKEKKRVIMGGDSCWSSNGNIKSIKDSKVFRNGDFLFGCTGKFRMFQLLKYKLELPIYDEKNVDLHYFMCTQFIDAVIACFDYNKWEMKDKNGDSKGSFLVAYKNRIFHVEGNFQVMEYDINYTAIGSGEKYALGALHSMQGQNITPEAKVLKALQAAFEFVGSVDNNYKILNSDE